MKTREQKNARRRELYHQRRAASALLQKDIWVRSVMAIAFTRHTTQQLQAEYARRAKLMGLPPEPVKMTTIKNADPQTFLLAIPKADDFKVGQIYQFLIDRDWEPWGRGIRFPDIEDAVQFKLSWGECLLPFVEGDDGF